MEVNFQPLSIVAVVPFSDFGGDELLMLHSANALALPAGNFRAGERVLDGAARIVMETAGVPVTPVRIVYVLESPEAGILFGVLCALGEVDDDAGDVRGEIVSLSSLEQDFEPIALREVLVEDLRSGFVRPVAHLIETIDGGQRRVDVSW